MRTTFSTILFFSTLSIFNLAQAKPVLADLETLRQAGAPVIYADDQTGVGYSVFTESIEQKFTALAHAKGRCGSFEALPETPTDLQQVKSYLQNLRSLQSKEISARSLLRPLVVTEKPEITAALAKLSADHIKNWVEWLSAFPTRYNKATNPNVHVDALVERLQEMTKASDLQVNIDLISHTSTKQKTLRVTIPGKVRPNEVIVLGGHLDSINGFFGTGKAPGADDNASGSGSLLEALRVMLTQPQPERTVEFYWYAGEESGLLGSAEVAKQAKANHKNVVAVLQLDMTMFPGNGEQVIASMTDFTTTWLRDYLVAVNDVYLKINIVEDKCGYGCSDHASWFRQGYSTLMPTEAKFDSMFQNIHTDKDVITPQSSFTHALVFSKIALLMALDLANSNYK